MIQIKDLINFNNYTDFLKKKQYNNKRIFETSPFGKKNILLNLSSNNNNNNNNNNIKKEKTDCFTGLYQNKTKNPNFKNHKYEKDNKFINNNNNINVSNNNYLNIFKRNSKKTNINTINNYNNYNNNTNISSNSKNNFICKKYKSQRDQEFSKTNISKIFYFNLHNC